MGGSFFGSIMAGTLLGWLADRWLDTEPWLIVAGIVLGSVNGFYRLWMVGRIPTGKQPVAAADTPTAHPAGTLTRDEVEDYLAGRPPVELNLVRSLLRRTVVVGPVAVLLAGLARGLDGAIAAAIGVVLVVGYYLLSGALMSWLARVSLGAYHAGALFGFVARLGLIVASMLAVAALFEVDRPVLGLTVIATYMVLLLWEAERAGTGEPGDPAKRGRPGRRAEGVIDRMGDVTVLAIDCDLEPRSYARPPMSTVSSSSPRRSSR